MSSEGISRPDRNCSDGAGGGERFRARAPGSRVRRFGRRAAIGVLGAAAAGTALGACATPFAKPTASGRRVQIVYEDWRTPWFPPMVQQMLDQFHDAHPGIQVFYTPDPEDLGRKLMQSMQAGTAPDVFQGCCTFFPSLAERGHTLDLRPYIRADIDQPTLDDWDPAQYRALSTRDGRQFGLPKYHGALALYYNRDIFELLGVAQPTDRWTHGDYLDAMKRLTLDRNGDRAIDFWGSMFDISWDRVQAHINSWGGHLVHVDDRCGLADPESIEAHEWLRARVQDDRVMARPQDVQKMATRDAFASGRLAMVEDGSWALKDILEKSDFRVGVVPFPAGPARRAALASTDGYGIYAGTRERDAAWELLKFLVSKDYGLAMARASLLQPARRSLVPTWSRIVAQEYPAKARELNVAAFADGHENGYSVTAEVFSTGMNEASQLVVAAWDRIFVLGGADVRSEMHAVCKAIGELQRDANASGGSRRDPVGACCLPNEA